MSFVVRMSPRAADDLEQLYLYVESQSGSDRAAALADEVYSFCERLAHFPERGRRRDDVKPGLRIIPVNKRIVLLFHILGDIVFIDRILYGGRDIGAAFRD